MRNLFIFAKLGMFIAAAFILYSPLPIQVSIKCFKAWILPVYQNYIFVWILSDVSLCFVVFLFFSVVNRSFSELFVSLGDLVFHFCYYSNGGRELLLRLHFKAIFREGSSFVIV